MSQLLQIDTGSIAPAKDGLRKVNHESDEFKDLVASVRQRGILNPINVIPKGDGTYTLVDGLHRYTAACMANLSQVPCHVLDAGEGEVQELQMEANLHKIETKPMEYTRQLLRVMAKNPNRTLEQQAARLKKSIGWVRDRLSLNVFEGEAAELIESGELAVSNAYALAKIAKINPGEVDEWLERAKTMAPEDFIPEALAREQALKAGQKQGKKPEHVQAAGPAVKLRKLGDIKTEYSRAKTGAVTRPDDPFAQGYLQAFHWVLSQDAANVAEWKKAEEERAAQRKAKAEEREAAKAAKAKSEGKLSLDDLVPSKILHPDEEESAE